MSDTATKPSYLGTLNAISLAESAAGVYLKAWADVTPDPDLKACLNLVAARETSHGDVFCRRIGELGFSLLEKDNPDASRNLARYANPDISDLEKIGPRREGAGNDPFGGLEQQIEDGIFDPLTALLMKWYIAEERDSGRLLNEAYECVRERAGEGKAASASTDTQALMDCMTSGFDRLENAIMELIKANTKAGSNSKAKV